MKVRAKELSKQDRIEVLDALYTAAASIKGREAMKMFLRDLLTESERIMLGRRILIARMLIAGCTHRYIASGLHVGLDTVSKVHHWLDDQLPGYETAIDGMTKEFDKRYWESKAGQRELYATNTLYRLKKKYPLHFLLFPWPKGKSR
ncbi:hypothetical protein HY970_03975 [Candidatus Kaiserbacteria bacterium]|nr:hypothetical protein [Candidatus Kaiserbacteria bacterium]